MTDTDIHSTGKDAGKDRLVEAVSCLETALAIAESAGLSTAAARIDHALTTMRGEIADQA